MYVRTQRRENLVKLSKIVLYGYILVLCGCIKYVDVPVWVCPEPNIPAKDTLKTSLVRPTDSDIEKIKAFMWDVVYLDGYSEQLLKVLEGYKKAPQK